MALFSRRGQLVQHRGFWRFQWTL